MSENTDQNPNGGCGNGSPIQACACCVALAQVRMPWLDPAVAGQYSQPGQVPPRQEPEKKKTVFLKFPGFGGKQEAKNSRSTKNSSDSTQTADAEKNEHTDDEEWQDLSIPKPKRIWHGIDGVAMIAFGMLIPAFVIFSSIASAPKRLTLVLLSHPIETAIELLLVAAIPIVNFMVWSAICKGKAGAARWVPIALGANVGTALVISGLCIASLFADHELMADSIGTDFTAGFTWMAMLAALAGAASGFMINKLRTKWELPAARLRVVAQAVAGIILSLVAFVGSEYRPWATKYAEQLATSANTQDRQKGLDWLRQINPERELRMECSDERAAGVAGVFFPLKQSNLHQLYFSLTGTPYSFRDMNTTDLASLPNDYLSRHVVGDQIKGLSLTRSSLSGQVHANTLSAAMSWTFVIKNNTSSPQEARAEFGLPANSAVTRLTVWRQGEPQEAKMVASGKIDGVSETAGHDSPAIISDLGHGRMLMHCYPVPAAEELKVRVSMVVPLKPDSAGSATAIMPQLIASNFALSGEHLFKMRSKTDLSCLTAKNLSLGTNSSGDRVLSGTLTSKQLEGSPFVLSAKRPAFDKPVVILDKLAVQMKQEDLKKAEEERKAREADQNRHPFGEQVVVMVDGSKVGNQLEQIQRLLDKNKNKNGKKTAIKTINPIYVVEKVEKIAAPAPKHLVVVIDGSQSLKSKVDELTAALKQIPSSIQTSVIVASQEQPALMQATELSKRLANIKDVKFVGGQDNLQAVVKAAELAGESKNGAVLWIHGPQPVINEEIYIMSPYITTPSFYELQVGASTDAFEFFKNHREIGPFEQIQQSETSLTKDLTALFEKWTPNSNAFVAQMKQSEKRPTDFVTPSEDEAAEVLTLHAIKECNRLIAAREMRTAARIAVAYHIVTPVSSAMVGVNSDQELNDSTQEELKSEAPILQGATNGTIGPQGSYVKVIYGINTAGTVRVNNLANLEAFLNILANLGVVGCGIAGLILIIHGFVNKATIALGQEIELGPGGRITIGGLLILIGLVLPGMLNWFVASARDANLFS